VASLAQLHAELIGFLRQHCPVRDQRHLVLLAWMVAGLLLSETICFDRWKTRLPFAHCLASSWQRRCQRWLSNRRIDVEAIYGPLIVWAIPVIARKDDAPAAPQAAIVNVAGLNSSSAGGGLIQTTSG